MTKTGRSLPTRRIVVLTPPGGQLIGVVGFIEAFDAANRILASRGKPPLYELVTVGLDAVTPSCAGPALQTVPSSQIQSLHTLVVGGALDLPEAPVLERLLAETGRLAERAERLVSVCMGAAVLGSIGALDGRRCTCHWLRLDEMRERFPNAQVQDDAIFTEDGPVFTSAGATAGIDLALHLVRLDGGPRLALAVARTLVVFAQRPGGQSQFSRALRVRSGIDDRMADLVAGVLEDPKANHTVDALATRVGMSHRNFARVFRAQTGQTPAAFVAGVRVEAAQRHLLQSDATLETVAEDCGFGTVETFRRTFRRVTGVSPSDYRRRFRVAR